MRKGSSGTPPTRSTLLDVAASAGSGRGSNSVSLRRYNAQLVLAALRRLGRASKAELARATTLTQNTAGLIVDDLSAQGLIRVVGRRAGGRGQPSTLLGLAPDGVWSLGVDVGRDTLIGVVVDFRGETLHVVERERPLSTPDATCAEILTLVDALRTRGDRRGGRFAGVGLALPFDLASWRRELQGGDELEGWRDYDLPAALRARLDLPLLVENDGTSAAVAELFLGHGRDLDDLACLTIGSALGGGVVVDGRTRRGATGNAGDIGLMPISSAAELAGDKGAGFEILLARASLRALRRRLAEAGAAVDGRAALETAMAAHPAVVSDWIEDAAQALVEPILSIGAILDPDAVTIDGDLGDDVLARLAARLGELAACAAAEARRPPRILRGRVGRNGAAVGAAILPLHVNFGPDPRTLLGAAA